MLAFLAFYLFFMKNKLKKLAAPVKGRLTSLYGVRIHPITKVQSFHNGIDLAVPSGSQIVSPFDGKVSSIYENAQGGKQLTILHDNGYKTGYAHLSKNNFHKIGDRVQKGQVIALSGNTGASTGAHLHFTVRLNGSLVNPLEHVEFT